MRRNTLKYAAFMVCGLLALAGRSAPADDGKGGKDKPTLSGTWEKKEAVPKLEFTGEDKLTIHPHGKDLNFQVECTYTLTKEGVVKVKVTGLGGGEDVVEKAKASVPVGMEFRFNWTVKGGVAKLDELEGEDVDHVKAVLEGEYSEKP